MSIGFKMIAIVVVGVIVGICGNVLFCIGVTIGNVAFAVFWIMIMTKAVRETKGKKEIPALLVNSALLIVPMWLTVLIK